MSMRNEQAIVFQCGGEQLVGIVHHAQSAAQVGVVVVVGGPQYRAGSHRQFTLMARAFAAAGIPTLRFDYRGMGDSSGAMRAFEDVRDDVRCAIAAFVEQVPSLQRVVLWGLCDAAAAVLMHGTDDPRVAGLVLVNPWVRSSAGEAQAYIDHYYGKRLLQRSFWVKVLRGQFPLLKSVREFLTTLRRSRAGEAAGAATAVSFVERMRAGLASFRQPVLVLVSERDLTAQEFVDLCARSEPWQRVMSARNVEVLRLAGADHTFSDRAALDTATQHCTGWFERCQLTSEHRRA